MGTSLHRYALVAHIVRGCPQAAAQFARRGVLVDAWVMRSTLQEVADTHGFDVVDMLSDLGAAGADELLRARWSHGSGGG